MSECVAIVGASGVLGRATLPRLLEAGYRVRALVRHEAQATRLAALGAESVVGDILQPESLPTLLQGCDAAMHLATAIPRNRATADWSLNDRIRREGTAYLLSACQVAGVRRYIQQSIALLMTGQGEAWVDETAAPVANPVTRSALDMERQVQASDRDWVILRGGLFYGPGAGAEAGWRAAAREGTLRLPGDGSAFISLGEASDMA